MYCSELFWPYIGGAELFGAKLVAAMRDRGYEVAVVTRHDTPDLPFEDQYSGVPIYRFPFWNGIASRNVEQLMTARQELARFKRFFAPDLIHIHGFGPSVLFHLETRHVHPAPLLATLTSEEKERYPLLGRLLESADWVTAKSTAGLDQARQFAPAILPRSSLIYNGLEVPSLTPSFPSGGAPRLLCLGRLARQKGFDLALAAFASLVDRFPNADLVIAGEGPERPLLERQVRESGLVGRVHFKGWVCPDDVFALINTSTTVVIPSRWEGLPSVVLQASMMARPIVATRVSGLIDVIVDQQTGLLVEPEDARALASAIARFLEEPEAAARIGRAARQRVQDLFSWNRCLDAYDGVWRRLITERNHVCPPQPVTPASVVRLLSR